eukprot:57989_1
MYAIRSLRLFGRTVVSNITRSSLSKRNLVVAGTSSIQWQKTVDSNINDLWKVVSDFGNVNYVSFYAKVVPKGERGVGMQRELHIVDNGGFYTEELTAIDNDSYSLTYDIINSNAPITASFSAYTGTIILGKVDNNKTDFNWSATFNVNEGHQEKDVQDLLSGVFDTYVSAYVEKANNT